jgi:hypothetical protein
MTGVRVTIRTSIDAAKTSPRSRQAELLVLCARLGFNP